MTRFGILLACCAIPLGALGLIPACTNSLDSTLPGGTTFLTPDTTGGAQNPGSSGDIRPTPAEPTTAPSGDSNGDDAGTGQDPDQSGDDSGGSPPATPDEHAPVALAQTVGTSMDQALAITLSATDADNDLLTYVIEQQPEHGTLTGTPPDVVYQPYDGYVGFDSLSFRADSGRPQGRSGPAAVRIWVIDEQDLSGQTVNSTIDPASEIEAWGLQVTAGQRVLLNVATTSGHLSPVVSLYPPGGGGAEDRSDWGRIDRQCQSTGHYTVTVESDTPYPWPGDYSLTLLNLGGQLASLQDLDGGPIASGATLSGTISTSADVDAYTFEGVAGQRVLINVVTTSGHLASLMSLYAPGGGGAETSTTHNRIDGQLQKSGEYTIVVEASRPYPWPGGYSVTLQAF